MADETGVVKRAVAGGVATGLALALAIVVTTEDEYGVGERVHAQVDFVSGCGNPNLPETLGRRWETEELAPARWIDGERGTLAIVAAGRAEFVAQRGGSVEFHELDEGAFSSLPCMLGRRP